jgi:xylulokinase
MEQAAGRKLERVIASGGGARTDLWLKIKASLYGLPIVVPKEPECGVVGCAAMAATATGRFSRLQDAIDSYVNHVDEVLPDPAWTQTYARMQQTFDRLYVHSQALYSDLDALANGESKAGPDPGRT